MLLELLHSLLHVRDIEGWQPQRTIKFFSWGTATGNDNAGVQEYLKVSKFTAGVMKLLHYFVVMVTNK